MSNKIYFTQDEKRGVSWYLTRAISTLLVKGLPRLSLSLSAKLLLTPHKRKLPESLPQGMEKVSFDSQVGQLQGYKMGQGPVVLLVHGWSGAASQFFELMQYIASQGYCAVSYDQPAHGLSEGKQSNLPMFILALEAVKAQLEQASAPVAVVSHSMGGVAVANVFEADMPLLMIAPVFEFKAAMQRKVNQAGLHPALLNNLLNKVSGRFGMVFEELEAAQHMGKFTSDLHIVHDTQDPLAQFESTLDVFRSHQHINLVSTSGQGHSRIINAQEVKDSFQSLSLSV